MSAVTGIVSSVANIGEGIFKTIDNSNLAHQLQTFKENLAQQEQTFSNELGSAKLAETSASTEQQNLNTFNTAIGKENTNTYLIMAGIILVAGFGILYFIEKNK